MRKLWVLCFLLLLWPAQAAATEEKDWIQDVFGCSESPCTVYGSKGGVITRFKNAERQAREKHTLFKIQGQCASSCAVLASNIPDQVCLMEGAVLEVHMGYTFTLYDPKGNVVDINITTGEGVSLYENPPEGYKRRNGYYRDLNYSKILLAWAKELGKMPASDDVYTLTWEEATMFWKPCE